MPSPLVGRILDGKFRLDEIVGAGSMGTVFRATQLTLSKTVAIKVMKKELAKEANYGSRFKREAKAASRLDHPNSVRVVDFGDDDGLLYIAMEYLNGRDLLTVISKEWPLAPARIIDLMSQVLAPLAVAHEMGIVHRDLKPENVMVLRSKDDEGREVELVKVCDFGVAKLLPDRKRDDGEDFQSSTATGTLTATGMLIGTPEYMSPEQVSGLDLDARTDIYSLGVILYQILTRTLPFEDKSAIKLAMRQIGEEPRRPSSIATGIDPKLEAICLRAMNKAPEDRFATAREMRAELRAVNGAKESGTFVPRSPLPPVSTRVVPQDGEAVGDETALSKAATVLASHPPGTAEAHVITSPAKVASPAAKTSMPDGGLVMPPASQVTITEPSAQQLKMRKRRMWLAAFAILVAAGLLLAFAR